MSEPPLVDLVGVGLNATDTLIAIDRYPERGSKMEYSGRTILPGGQTASAVVACRIWGLRTRYVGRLGDDEAARLHRREFERAGVETRIVTVEGAESPQSLILVDGGGERTVLNRRDPRLALEPGDLDRSWITQARALLVDGLETAAATLAARWARASGVPVIADLDEVYPGVEDLISAVDLLIVSRDLPRALTGERSLARALRLIRERYGCALAAATLGPDGVLAWDGTSLEQRTGYRVPVVDTTGAGDIFHAGFIYGLLEGWPPLRRLDFACAAAALNSMARGARGNIGTVAEIEELMATRPRYAPSPVEDL